MTLEGYCRNSTPSNSWERRLQAANLLSRVSNEGNYDGRLLAQNILKWIWLRPSRRLFWVLAVELAVFRAAAELVIVYLTAKFLMQIMTEADDSCRADFKLTTWLRKAYGVARNHPLI